MGYRSLRQCVDDLERQGHVIQIKAPIDPNLEMAAIQRRVVAAGGPALLFTNVVDCRFQMLANLFGTRERIRLIFRSGLEAVKQLVELRRDPQQLIQRPWTFRGVPWTGISMLPKKVSKGPILVNRTTISQLPQLRSWPADGGTFITLPQVYTEDVGQPGFKHSNLGMYRVQLSGSRYQPDQEIGLHYQIHRSIGVHHEAALTARKPFRVNVFVGGPPAMTVAAVMPLPEGMSELGFAGALGGNRVRMISRKAELPIHADTDFCIVGEVIPDRLEPEGPFGDHLGYYSLAHPFPVMRVKEVYHRNGAIWPFTVVGRPPQEDSMLGDLIHEITGPLISEVLPGVRSVHAVDASGVHPLLLAIGSERYMPFLTAGRPQEILTQANAILGQGQLSLAKFLLIVAEQDNPQLDIHDISQFIRHLLERADWPRDLHFYTQTTVDTLDYSGTHLNAGSKVVMAATGPARFELATQLPGELNLPEGFCNPRFVLPGVLAITGPHCPEPSFDYDVSRASQHDSRQKVAAAMEKFCNENSATKFNGTRWIVIVNDSQFVAESLRNFLWVTFTRTDPATDLYGIKSFIVDKHWGCQGPLVFDARIKPHHAPVLEEPPDITRRVEALAAPGAPLDGIY